MVTITVKDFLADPTGAKFADVVHDQRSDFQAWLDFFSDETRQIRMEDAEEHHLRPALAGVVRELEENPAFMNYFEKSGEGNTARGRQAIGVIVRMIMVARGWQQSGRKGSLGQRIKSQEEAPGPKHNTSGLSKWFSKVEHYQRIS